MSPLSIIISVPILWDGSHMATGVLNFNLNTTSVSPILAPHPGWLLSFHYSMLRKLAMGATMHSWVCSWYLIPFPITFSSGSPSEQTSCSLMCMYLCLPATRHLTLKCPPCVAAEWTESEWTTVHNQTMWTHIFHAANSCNQLCFCKGSRKYWCHLQDDRRVLARARTQGISLAALGA